MIMKLLAWDPIDKKMGEVETYHPKTGKVMFENDSWDWYKRDRIVRRSTGLVDRNGKEIWEDDLYKIDGHWDMYKVTMENGCFGLEGMKGAPFKPLFVALKEQDDYPLTYLGNVWENPELLEVKA